MSASGQFVNGWTHAATLATAGASLATAHETVAAAPTVFWAVGAAYVLVLTWGIYRVERRLRKGELTLYFLVASVLLLFLLYASRAGAWLAGLPLISHLALFAPWPWAAFGGAAYLGALLVCADLSWNESVAASINTAPALLFVIVFSLLARRQTEWRLRAESLSKSLQHANEQLRDHATKVEELSVMRERNRVAREVHDGLGHYLTTIHVQLEAALVLLDRDVTRAKGGVARAQLLARQGLQDVRESVGLLRQGATAPRPSLQRTLEDVVTAFGEQTQPTPVSLHVRGEERALPQTVDHALRRVLQEALTNVQRHAHATHVEVTLEFDEHAVCFEIVDDGVGTQTANTHDSSTTQRNVENPNSDGKPQGHGLAGIRERIFLLGGQVETTNREAGGFRLWVRVPT